MSSPLFDKFLTKKYASMAWKDVAAAPVSAIRGVSDQDHRDLVEAFAIDTVQDLALNEYVLLAQGINVFSKASGVIFDKTFRSKEYDALRQKPVHVIAGVSEQDAALLKRAFGIDTIQELAENRYVCIAQTIMTLAFLEDLASHMD